jgi:glycerophosphoryl diester phosphodiesterase
VADGVEFDVRRSLDGKLVLSHNATSVDYQSGHTLVDPRRADLVMGPIASSTV